MQTEDGPGYAEEPILPDQSVLAGNSDDLMDISPVDLGAADERALRSIAPLKLPQMSEIIRADRDDLQPDQGPGDLMERDQDMGSLRQPLAPVDASLLPQALLVGGPSGGEADASQNHPGLGSAPISMPTGGSGRGDPNAIQHRMEEEFVSDGKHVIYCGADIPLESIEHAGWHHSPRQKDSSPLAAASSPHALLHGAHGSYAAGSGGHSPNPAEAFALSPQGAAHMEAAAGRASPVAASMVTGEEGAAGAPGHEDVVQDEVAEVETETPGGYHVAAMVVHPANARDPDELIVSATAIQEPQPHNVASAQQQLQKVDTGAQQVTASTYLPRQQPGAAEELVMRAASAVAADEPRDPQELIQVAQTAVQEQEKHSWLVD